MTAGTPSRDPGADRTDSPPSSIPQVISMEANLRPLSFGEILDGAFTLYRRNFAAFVGTAFAAMVVLVVVAAMLGVVFAVSIPALGAGGLMLLFGLVVLTGIAATAMAFWGALTWRASQAYIGHPTTTGQSMEAGIRSAVKLVGVAVAAVVLAVVGMWVVVQAVEGASFLLGSAAGTVAQIAMVLVMGVGMMAVLALVAASLFATVPAVVLEGKGTVAAVSRSFELVEGALARVAGMLLVSMLIASLPGVAVVWLTGGFEVLTDPASAAVNASLEPASRQIAEQVLSVLANVLTAPFLASVMVLTYYDRRVRTEALDVRLAAERLAVAGD